MANKNRPPRTSIVAQGDNIAQATGQSTAIVLHAHFHASNEKSSEKEPALSIETILELPIPFWTPELGDSALLRPESRIVPFAAHSGVILDQLIEWALSASDYSLRILAGPAGAGKTRLSLELCDRLQASGWAAGFLICPISITKSQLINWWGLPHSNRLVIVDYAESRPSDVILLLETLVRVRPKCTTRIILLARNTRSWWYEILTRSRLVSALAEGHAFGGTVWLDEETLEQYSPTTAFTVAAECFARALDLNDTSALTLTPPPFLEATGGEPLYIQMAALAALRGEHPDSLDRLLRSTLTREQSFWLRFLNRFELGEIYLSAFTQLVAAVTLVGGMRTAESCYLLMDQLPRTRLLGTREKTCLSAALQLAYPKASGVDALRPDRLGEVLVLDEVIADNNFISSICEACPDQQDLNNILAVLERIVILLDLPLGSTLLERMYDAVEDIFRRVRPRTASILDRAIRKQAQYKTDVFQRIRNDFIRCFEAAGLQAEIDFAHLRPYQAYADMRKKHLSFVQSADLARLRVTVTSTQDCYLCLGIVHNYYKPVPGRLRDLIAIGNTRRHRGLYTSVITPLGTAMSVLILSREMASQLESLPGSLRRVDA